MQVMHQGFPDLGVTVNARKTRTNFTDPNDTSSLMPWNGLLIDTNTLEVRADYSRYLTTELKNFLTVGYSDRPGEALKRSLKRSLQTKCHPLLLDEFINRKEAVVINVVQMLLLSAMKLCCALGELRSHKLHFANDWVFVLVQDGVEFFLNLANSRFEGLGSLARQDAGFHRFPLSNVECSWLGYRAFFLVFHKKQTKYRELLDLLYKEAGRLKYLLKDQQLDEALERMYVNALHESEALLHVRY